MADTAIVNGNLENEVDIFVIVSKCDKTKKGWGNVLSGLEFVGDAQISFQWWTQLREEMCFRVHNLSVTSFDDKPS